MRHLTLIIATLALAVATPAIAGKGGNGNGNDRDASGSCSVDGDVVHGTGLPNWTLMNFMVTDGSGTTGWALGQTDDGSWTVNVPTRSGPTTYEFASRTWGPSGSKYDVYASCSVS